MDLIMIIFELFKLKNGSKYHFDYYDQLEDKIKSLDRHLGYKAFQANLMSEYLSCCVSRFKFAKEFVSYLNKFILLKNL